MYRNSEEHGEQYRSQMQSYRSPCIELRENLPRHLSVDRVVHFLQIDEAHVHGNLIFLSRPSSCNRRTVNTMSTVDRAGRKPRCSSRSIFPSFAAVAQEGRNDFQQQFTCIGNKRNPSAVAAVRAISLLVKGLNDRVFPLIENCPVIRA